MAIIHTNVKLAKEWGIDEQWAIKRRQAFLTKEIWRLKEEIDEIMGNCGEIADAYLNATSVLDRISVILEYRKELREADRLLLKIEGEITPAMIERAKSTPIETIIEFKRGVARCINPEHADNNPSMFHGKRTNTAQCPACGFKTDAIGAYRIMFGASFPDAVKRLAQ